MEMVPVESSNFAAVGYDPETGEMRILFRRSGRTYAYYNVPASLHTALMLARSKGGYFNLVIRWRFRGYKIV